MTTEQQSNQNAGTNLKPCPWCQLWQAAYWASQVNAGQFVGAYGAMAHNLERDGQRLLVWLEKRETDCPDCRRSAEIQRGEVLGEQQAKWRAAMWRENPVMRQFMRASNGETFGEPTGD